MKDRGRDDGIKVAPPSEPDRRFSRIRLSRRLGSDSETEDFEGHDRLWRYRPVARAVVRLNSPASSKKRLGHRR
jgi:hypothetical protein